MKTLKTLVAMAALALMCHSASAVGITGGISLAGGYVTDTGNLNTANAFTAFNNVLVTSVSGIYAAVPVGQVITQNGFSFDPFPGPGVTPLWHFSIGLPTGNNFSFDLLTIQTPEQPNDNTLTLRGSGVLHAAGFDNTVGSYLFTANQAGGTFSFSSSQAAGVPDGGTTIALLGLALVGVGAVRRKLNV